MKSRTILGFAVLVIALSVSVPANAQPDESLYAKYDFQKLMKSFDASLRSDVPGIVESTKYNLVDYKCMFPDREYSRFVQVLNDVARSSADSTIAYKATLARMYLAYGTKMNDTSVFAPVITKPRSRSLRSSSRRSSFCRAHRSDITPPGFPVHPAAEEARATRRSRAM